MKYVFMALVVCPLTMLFADDWPREVVSSEGTITMYQPQIESYSGNSLRARAAISIVPVGKTESVYGAIWVNCKVLIDRPTRTVTLEEMEVRRTRFPAGTDVDTAKIAEALEEMIPRLDLTFSLDLLLESVDTAQKERESAHELESNPPKIIIMDHPAVLVQIDGDPIFFSPEGTSLKRVVNTPYFLVQDPATNAFYLHGGDIWFSAPVVNGPWQPTDAPPQSVVELFNSTPTDEQSSADSTTNDLMASTGQVPEIVVSTVPAELISTDGPIHFEAIEGTALLYASNTPSRVFVDTDTKQYFLLISGRWFSALQMSGPWTSVAPDKLPADFARIPPGSPDDDVLASVPGTLPAKEAIYDAQIPQMAEVDRWQATSQVEYDGDPQFQPIENTGMDYALNASTAVIRVNGRYYDCDRGVWFEGESPNGPWSVCVNVPEVIYSIPPSCPDYCVRYVRVYSSTPDIVYVGYTAGYTGCYVYGRTVVYGTGYHYQPWYKHVYYSRPLTWGFGVHYDPSGWSFGAGWRQPHGWFVGESKVVHTGWWGPAETHPAYRSVKTPTYREGYNPAYRPATVSAPVLRTPQEVRRTSGVQRSATLYDQRGAGITRPVGNGQTSRSTGATRTTTPSRNPAPPMPRPAPPPLPERPAPVITPAPKIVTRPSPRENNVYATPEGVILRSTPQGWQQRDQNAWKAAPQPPPQQAVVHDSQVRQRAAERSASFQAPPPPRPAPKPNPPKENKNR
ncbi:MAG TPA: hypothetical protein VMM57_03460 [Bacteroidota bacterium]|nr:hypothetical protein [Bacteroidota bacterium]